MTSRTSQPMLWICVALCGGILTDRFIGRGDRTVLWLLSSTMWMLWWISFRNRYRASSCWLLLTIACTGAAAHHSAWRCFPENHIALRPLATKQPETAALRCQVTSVLQSSPLPPEQPLATLPRSVETTFLAAVDSALHKIEQQIRTHKEKLTGHRATGHKHIESPADHQE